MQDEEDHFPFCARLSGKYQKHSGRSGSRDPGGKGIPFPVSTRIHEYEAYIAGLNREKKEDVREGLSTGF